jgi:FlaA1/EpsC-like NDP-sugar epimerase
MDSSLLVFLWRRRVAADLIAWTLAVAAVTAGMALFRGHQLRSEMLIVQFTRRLRSEMLIALFVWLVVAGAQVVAGLASGLYRGRARVASFEEVSWLSATMACAGVTVSITALLAGPAIGAVLAAIATPLALLCALASRLLWRYRYEQRTVHRSVTSAPLIVFGAGEGGYQVVRAMLRKQDCPYRPVAILDDDPRKRHLRLMGVPVEGGRDSLAAVAKRTGCTALLVAIPSASADLICEVTDLATENGLQVKVLPGVSHLMDGRVGVVDIRDLDPEDLVGRRPVGPELDQLCHYVKGKRVLVTGAGGSIGSELCRALVLHQPAQLLKLDRDESALHALQLSLEGHGLLCSDDLLLADLRDASTMQRIFAEHRPQIVFHAAALKHLSLLEQYPAEAVQTNVRGTLTVLEAAAAAGVERFVNISTDKAAAPVSVLGYSKRITERLTAAMAETAPGAYVSVRFGNVLGSRGSVLTAFKAQVAGGGPVTVTHPDVTRYFMTVHEAVRLVLAAGGVGRSGEVLVLDMGQPARIADVAARVAASAGRPVEIVYTGLRPGEKLHEVLFDPDEVPVDSSHQLIAHVPVPPLASAAISQLDPQLPGSVLISTLRELALGSHSGSAVGQVRASLCAASLPAWPALSGATWRKLLSLRAMRSSESTASPLTTGA